MMVRGASARPGGDAVRGGGPVIEPQRTTKDGTRRHRVVVSAPAHYEDGRTPFRRIAHGRPGDPFDKHAGSRP